MNLISFYCFAIFFAFAFSMFKKNTDVFAPGRLFLLVWSLVIGLATLKLSRLQREWSSFGWVVILVPVLSFTIGMFVVYVLNSRHKLFDVKETRNILRKISINSSYLFSAILILFTLYIISFFASFLIMGYLPIFSKFAAVARMNWGVFGLGLFVQSFPVIIFLSILFLFVVKGEKFKKLFIILILITTFFSYLSLLQRYYIIFAIMMSMVFTYYYSDKLQFRNVLLILLVMVAIIYGLSSVRMSTYAINLLYYVSEMKYSSRYAMVTEPYMYLVMNLENFAHAAEKVHTFYYGYFSFDFVFAITGLKHVISEYLHIMELPFLLSNNYNTYTMFFVYFRDFGIYGPGLISFMIGFFITTLYYKMKIQPSIHSVTLYSVFSFVLMFSFFIPIITWLHFVFNLILLFSITKLIESKTIKNKT